MSDQVYAIATLVAATGAALRGVLVLLVAVRTFLGRRRFASRRIDRGFLLTAPEPFLLIAVAWGLCANARDVSGAVDGALAAALLGVALVLGGWALALWTFASWPSIFVGHALLNDHRLVTHGAYGVVRHPVYLAAFLIWLGLGVAFASHVALGITILYVIPAYLLYIRDEEVMMSDAFGDAYHRYRATVPMLIPRWSRRHVARPGAA
jgi:protein-S-isoprenylcysteine O-methyltransferase Ste14